MSTWPDFEKFFEKPCGQGQCWCTFHHRPRPIPDNEERNRREKRSLIETDLAHGTLVYASGEPVGRCQYGLKEELPRMDFTRAYRKLAIEEAQERLWRITCFVVDRNHRRSGVASIGLKAALRAIKRRGGGVVEAYPISRWGPSANWYGTVSMFRKQGFKKVAALGESNLVMRKSI